MHYNKLLKYCLNYDISWVKSPWDTGFKGHAIGMSCKSYDFSVNGLSLTKIKKKLKNIQIT